MARTHDLPHFLALSNMLSEVLLALRIGPENSGVSSFYELLERENRHDLLSEHFSFLGLPLSHVGTFDKDFELRFEQSDLEIVIYNDDDLDERTEDYVAIRIRSKNESRVKKVVKMLQQQHHASVM